MSGEYNVKVQRKNGVTSSAPVVIYNVTPGSSIRIFPTSAGTANVYSSGSPQNLIAADITAGNSAVTGNTNARWSAWGAGAVTADTQLSAIVPQMAVALVVTSGTWSIEVTQ